MADFNIFGTAPESLAGLLGEQATKDLQRKAMTTGLINTALGYLVQPKNQNLGLGRIIGQSLMSGMTGAQGVYSGALEDWQTKQKIAELQRKNALQEKVQGMVGNIADPNEQLYAQLAPEQYVASKVKPAESPLAKIDRKDYTKESFNKYLKTGNIGDLETVPKDTESWSEPYQLGGQTVQKNNATGQIRQAVNLPSTTTVTYGAPVSGLDAQGNPVFFQPSKGGGAPAIIPGVTPQPAVVAAPTESQAKAATFYSQMTSASDELNNLKTEGFDPNKPATQAEVSIAGTKASAFVSPEAQRARQAQEQWAESFLRIKTGAAATQGEVDRNVRTFFPSIGDSPATVTQKERARARAEQDVLKMTKPPATTKQQKFTVQDQQALDWANSNPTDPRAKAIKQRLGL